MMYVKGNLWGGVEKKLNAVWLKCFVPGDLFNSGNFFNFFN